MNEYYVYLKKTRKKTIQIQNKNKKNSNKVKKKM